MLKLTQSNCQKKYRKLASAKFYDQGQIFLSGTQKNTQRKEFCESCKLLFCTPIPQTYSKTKMEAANWEKMLTTCTSNKERIFWIYTNPYILIRKSNTTHSCLNAGITEQSCPEPKWPSEQHTPTGHHHQGVGRRELKPQWDSRHLPRWPESVKTNSTTDKTEYAVGGQGVESWAVWWVSTLKQSIWVCLQGWMSLWCCHSRAGLTPCEQSSTWPPQKYILIFARCQKKHQDGF